MINVNGYKRQRRQTLTGMHLRGDKRQKVIHDQAGKSQS